MEGTRFGQRSRVYQSNAVQILPEGEAGGHQVSEEAKEELKSAYFSLNPAQLKRSIDTKLDKLHQTYDQKGRAQQVDPHKRLVPRMVTSFMIQQPKVGSFT